MAKRVVVTGAAGQVAYSLVQQLANGNVFGATQPIILVLLDLPTMHDALVGVCSELDDCAFPLLKEVIPSVDEEEAFKDIDVGFLIGAMPRKAGMERGDLLAANVKIFKKHGESLAKSAKVDCKVVVVGNPANTNAYICAKYAAPRIPAKNITAMTRLDHNRAVSMIAKRVSVPLEDVSRVVIWGNHSATQYPDVHQATIKQENYDVFTYAVVSDDAWLNGDFMTKIQKRGAEIIRLRKQGSAMSASKAACDHIRDWVNGTQEGEWVSMAVASDGSYGVPEGLVFSFPVTCENGEWKIVQGLQFNDFAKGKIDITLKELEAEREIALKCCQ